MRMAKPIPLSRQGWMESPALAGHRGAELASYGYSLAMLAVLKGLGLDRAALIWTASYLTLCVCFVLLPALVRGRPGGQKPPGR